MNEEWDPLFERIPHFLLAARRPDYGPVPMSFKA